MTAKLSSAWLWRLLHLVFPLEQKLNPLLRRIYVGEGWRRVRWGRFWLTIDAGWFAIASSASGVVYRGPRRQSPEFWQLLAPRLPSGTIIDVGANIGTYTLGFRQHSNAAIIAFEPDPETFRLLSETLVFNAVANVSDDSDTVTVSVVRLDDRLARAGRIGLIKIDCEGYEWHVLDGCRDILRTQRPVLFVELHPRLIAHYGHSLQDVCNLLREAYALSFWDLSPMRRSRYRWARFLARYWPRLKPLADEAALLSVADREPRPDQLFMLALPKA
jgi:hypothetical protein